MDARHRFGGARAVHDKVASKNDIVWSMAMQISEHGVNGCNISVDVGKNGNRGIHALLLPRLSVAVQMFWYNLFAHQRRRNDTLTRTVSLPRVGNSPANRLLSEPAAGTPRRSCDW